jgi:rubrerythrin
MTDPAHFSLEEVLSMAISIEENGKKFYAAAAAAAKKPELKELFDYLVREEMQHTAFFGAMRTSINSDEHFNPTDPYFEEAGYYLKSLADVSVFTEVEDGAKLAKLVADEDAVLDKAISMEKEAILFYFELKEMVRHKDHAVMDTIIAEERKHVSMLMEIKEKLA